jgi:glucose-1-phosphate cytidylyltransferase
MFTYGDGVADIDVQELLRFHRAHGKLATITTVHSPERFGRIAFDGDNVTCFHEKPQDIQGWINGGYFVLDSGAIDYVSDDDTVWERGPLERLAADGQLVGYRHNGFWSCMDTLKEKNYLEELWARGNAPWTIWKTRPSELAVNT